MIGSAAEKTLARIVNKQLIHSAGYINGKWSQAVHNKGTFDVYNPANGNLILQLPKMGEADALESIEISSRAFHSWKTTTARERSSLLTKLAQLMQENRNDLASIITLEAGKPFKEALGEVAYATSFVQLYAEEATRVRGDVLQSPVRDRRLLAVKQPVGPAALITPWNFPSAMITRKLAPALAAGCTAVIKPAEATPLSALAICALVEQAGFPAGVVNCLTVDRSDVQEVGLALCHSDKIRKLSFTGSTPVGKWLMRESASTVKKFRNAGQACIASNRVLVQSGVMARFSAMVAEAVSRHVADCVSKGATVLTGGRECQALNQGMFGLAAYACTKDLARAWRVSEALETGMVGINEGSISYDLSPFGGVKESGIGREGGSYGLEEYLET
eukprot:gene29194-38261_t